MNDPNGSQSEINVDGVARSYRDLKAIAVEAALFLREQRPATEVRVRDLRNNSSDGRARGRCERKRPEREVVVPVKACESVFGVEAPASEQHVIQAAAKSPTEQRSDRC